ncbi:ABC transporter permease [Cognatishimia maritima]|uniref:ABC-type polysaccharide/polyol phosphate export permease n=1 Tax=Cognatishimia maritima TaxID=870908 RepID=A0A1M5P6D8_9RHOB|nr:ABC transporter permease [Cognatishimia maritima]SHG97391.1 ABC-type polysaccharide/polyol phosphate export permease [Cognatishimia maritima]
MFQQSGPKTTMQSAITIFELVYHSMVRNVRKTHGNAMMSILLNMMQTAIFVLAFFFMFSLLNLRGAAIRGDFLLYIMSGVFLFMTHTKTMGAVVGAEGPSSPMMKHAPMNTAIAILAAAFGTLYIQALSLFAILFIYHVGFTPIEVDDPIGALGMLLISWFTGATIGLVLLAIKPWYPTFVSILNTVYARANMIASGKMFVANTLPGFMLAMFDWNPLFHTIDQARGFVFINYAPRNSSPDYPLYVGLVLLMIGLMGEFYTRKQASLSWGSKR